MYANKNDITAIAMDCGLDITSAEPVHGGDINACYRLTSADGTQFLKVNDARLYPGLFDAEAAGLEALRSTNTIRVPAVLQCRTLGNLQYLLLEWIEQASSSKSNMALFGSKLAQLHLQPQAYFGGPTSNYIGSLQQVNSPCNEWWEFFSANRILPLVKHLVNAGTFSAADAKHAAVLCKNIKDRFPAEPPALLHGDLWSGNYLFDRYGNAVLFDPALYFGHREMDIGMSKLFGGFDNSFYDGYQSVYPLELGWQQRLPLTQLYPLLVHAILFGGQYISAARETIRRYS